MKNTIIVTAICCLVFGGYLAGQNQTKEKRIEPCCCKHTQQIAEDLHWIRKQMEKPYAPREIPIVEGPGNPPDRPLPPVQIFDPIKLEKPNFNIPKTPKKPK